MSFAFVRQIGFAVLGPIVIAVFAGAGPVSAQAAPYCAPGQPPQFVLGFAELHQRLGATMGNPLDCEHVDAKSGDTQQHTSAGLAYFLRSTGLVAFTNGWGHYALVDGQVQLWRNASEEPPQPTAEERAYINSTVALRGRVDQLDADLTDILHQAQSGNLDTVDFGALGSDIDELEMLREEFMSNPGVAHLSAFTDQWLQVQDADIAAGQALLQARLDSDQTDIDADLATASTELLRRDQLREAAAVAYSEVLPVAFH